MQQLREIYEQYSSFFHAGAVLLVAVLSYYIFKRYFVRLISYTVHKTKTTWDNALVEQGVFSHLPSLVPVVIVYLSAEACFPPFLAEPIRRLATAYFVINVIILINRLLNALLVIYQSFPVAQRRPIKGYVQIIKIFVIIIGVIVVVSLLMNQSPWAFLGGVGAMTAVLLLIFRDTILSFVASIQISTNDMVRVGDWIEMPKYEADGTVIDMALNTVKVQNWDKTITTIPTYKLVEDSFKNWRGMTEAGGRRIARSLMIDQSTVRYLQPAEIQRFKKILVLRDYLVDKEEELVTYHRLQGTDLSEPLNGRRLTNLGTFRAYVAAYLRHHPRIRKDLTFLVRQLEPTSTGLPLQIYVFTDTTVWAEYEAIQADVFDHLLAALPEFGLRVFQPPTGSDLVDVGGMVASLVGRAAEGPRAGDASSVGSAVVGPAGARAGAREGTRGPAGNGK